MEKVETTKRGFWAKEVLGIPFYIVLAISSYIVGEKSILAAVAILAFGFYAYNFVYWKLYQKYFLKNEYVNYFKFYASLLIFQVASIGVVIYAAMF